MDLRMLVPLLIVVFLTAFPVDTNGAVYRQSPTRSVPIPIAVQTQTGIQSGREQIDDDLQADNSIWGGWGGHRYWNGYGRPWGGWGGDVYWGGNGYWGGYW